MSRSSFSALALLGATLCAGCLARRTPPLPASIPSVTGDKVTPFTMQHIDVAIGSGAPMAARRCAFANYTGWLTNGTKFDSSRDTMPNGQPRTPIRFAQGARQVIPGWDAGFEGMRVGGKRRLFIPYQLAYGELGRPPLIPPKAQLIFDVELMAVADTLPRTTPAPRGQPSPPLCPEWSAVSGAK